jgi:Flp pilus assembly protein TadG
MTVEIRRSLPFESFVMRNHQNETELLAFSHCERGNAAIVFGLSFIPLMLMLGAGVDYGRVVAMRANLQQATDAAALAVAKNIVAATTNQQAQSQAQVYLLTNVHGAVATVTKATISSDRLTLCLDSQAQVATTLMKIAHVETLTAKAAACASMPGGVSGTYEIALVLDNSGSMSKSAGRKSKMDALREAATSFVDNMYSKTSDLKMSVVPFSAGVRVLDPSVASNRALSWIDVNGNNSQHWLAFGDGSVDPATAKAAAKTVGFTSRFDIFAKLKKLDSSWDWGGCFEGPKYPLNVSDPSVDTSNAETLFVPFLAPDEPATTDKRGKSLYGNNYLAESGGSCSGSVSGDWNLLTRVCKYKKPSTDGRGAGPNSSCPSESSQTVLQLTPTQTTITTKIGNLSENGYTNLHEGFMWGWRTISPAGPFAAGRPYGTSQNHKIIVFMTDGFNNWLSDPGTVGGSAYQAAGYYSYNGNKNLRFPDGTAVHGNGVDYQTSLEAAAGSSSDYHDTSREMQDELTLEACKNAKAAGVEIYTIGFSVPVDPIDAQGLKLMQDCATDANHYFAATDVDSLNAAFSTIGSGLGKLRLSR